MRLRIINTDGSDFDIIEFQKWSDLERVQKMMEADGFKTQVLNPYDATVLNDRFVVDIEVDGIDTRDAPDFCDAYISDAYWFDTDEPLSEDELEELNEDTTLIYERVLQQLY